LKKRFTPYIYTGVSYFRYYSKEYVSIEKSDELLNREDDHGLLAMAGIGLKLMTKYLFWELEVTTDNSTHLGFRQIITNVNIGISI
jgi:outer membrane protein W